VNPQILCQTTHTHKKKRTLYQHETG